MRKILLFILFALGLGLGAQAQTLASGQMVNGYEVATSLPATCHPAAGRRILLMGSSSSAPVLYYHCTAPNVWTAINALPGQYALVFDSTKNHHVDHGKFWPAWPTTFSKIFYWEAWVKPDGNGGYVISEGYGSLHALLFGAQADNVGGHGGGSVYCPVTGNVTTGTSTVISFGSDDGPVAGEWAHFAVACDGNWIVSYVNGVPAGIVSYPYATRSTDGNGNQGQFWVGGSGHSNYGGSIAMIRGFEGANPLYGVSASDGLNDMLVAFRPETRFGPQAQQRGYSLSTERLFASFLADYTTPATTILDMSPVGYNGGLHPGQLWSTNGTGDGLLNQGFGYNPTQSAYPLPAFTPDLTAPTAARTTAPTAPSGTQNTNPGAPGSSKIFDSFSRANQTYAFDTATPVLGSTEASGASLGAKAWQHNVPASTLTVGATGGTFTLTYSGQTTASINYNDNAATVKTRLEALSTIGSGNAVVSLVSTTYTIYLSSTVGIPSSSNFTVNTGSLTGGSASLAAASNGRGDNDVRWGILNGRACPLGGPGSYQVAWTANNSADMDIYVDRRVPTSLNRGETGIAYRVQDGRNFNYVIVSYDGSQLDVEWGDYTNATRTNNAGKFNSADITGSWTTLRVVVSGTGANNVSIYKDASLVKTFSSSTFSTATGAGIVMADFGGGFAGTARFDNFTVK